MRLIILSITVIIPFLLTSCTKNNEAVLDNPYDMNTGKYSPPKIISIVTSDSSLSVNDTATVTVSTEGTEKAKVDSVKWEFYSSIDGKNYAFDSTIVTSVNVNKATLKTCYATIGEKRILVKAINEYGVLSDSSFSIDFEVLKYAPILTIKDTLKETYINTPVTLSISAHDSNANGKIRFVRWKWLSSDTTIAMADKEDSFAIEFPKVGTYNVFVSVIDDDNNESSQKQFTIIVHLGQPTVSIKEDTAIGLINTPITLTAVGKDSNATGHVVAFQWKSKLIDTVVTAENNTSTLTITPKDTLTDRYTVYAIDNDSVVSTPDSITVIITDGIPKLTAMNDFACSIKREVTLTATAKDNGSITKYLWSINDNTFNIETSGGEYKKIFENAGIYNIFVKAIDNDGNESNIDTIIATVNENAPTVKINNDTTIAVNDTVTVYAKASDNGYIKKYIWIIDGDTITNTSQDSLILSVTDSSIMLIASKLGSINVSVSVMDDDSLFSLPATMKITTIKGEAPTISTFIAHSTSVYIHNPITLTAKASSTNGVSMYYFSKNGIDYNDSSSTGTIKIKFDTAGTKTIKVKARDKYGLWSEARSLTVHVDAGAPVNANILDTIVSQFDTVKISFSAKDTNGTIKTYHWSVNGTNTWTDSGTIGLFTKLDGGFLTVVWTAEDNDGQYAKPDTFVIKFNRAPNAPVMKTTSILPNEALEWSCTDPDSDDVSFNYTLSISKDSTSFSQVYNGSSTTTTLTNLDGGIYYYYVLTATDKFGSSTSTRGTFFTSWMSETENNNTYQVADTLTANGLMYGTMSDNDTDWIDIVPQEDGYLTILFTAGNEEISSSSQMYLGPQQDDYLESPYMWYSYKLGQIIHENQTITFCRDINVAKNHEYFFYLGVGIRGDYKIETHFTPSAINDNYELNNSKYSAKPIETNNEIKASITQPEDNTDWYKYVPQNTNAIKVELENLGNSSYKNRISLYMQDNSGNNITELEHIDPGQTSTTAYINVNIDDTLFFNVVFDQVEHYEDYAEYRLKIVY